MILSEVAASGQYLHFTSLHLDRDVFDITLFGHQLGLKWYSLAYIAGILIGWWYLLKLLAQPGAPMARRHADDLVFYATIGIIAGGRIGYVLFYAPEMLARPLRVLALWDGGMSFHGGAIGTTGMSAVVLPGDTPCLRCLFPEPPASGTTPTCDTAGVLGPDLGGRRIEDQFDLPLGLGDLCVVGARNGHDADHAVARSRRHRGLGLLRRFQAQVYLVGCLSQQEQTTEDQHQIAPGNVLSQHAEPGLDQPDNPGQRE